MEDKEILVKKAKYFFLQNTVSILRIKGRSMYPALQEGWSAQISPVDKKKIKIWDIIVFDINGELTVHRIVGKISKDDKAYFLQKGDNELKPGFIGEDQAVGKVSNVFNSDHKEVPLKLWKNIDSNAILIFKLLRILYLILYQAKKVIFRNKKNSLVRLFWNIYWALFYNLSRKSKKVYGY